MTRTSLSDAIIKVIDLMLDGTPRCVAEIAREIGINRKTAQKVMDVIMDVVAILDGNTVRKQVIGNNNVFTMAPSPKVRHDEVVDMTMLFEMRKDLNDIETRLTSPSYDTDDIIEMRTIIRKNSNIITRIIEPDVFVPDEVIELRRVMDMITSTMKKDDDDACEELIGGLESLFTTENKMNSVVGHDMTRGVLDIIERRGHYTKPSTVLNRIHRYISESIGE